MIGFSRRAERAERPTQGRLQAPVRRWDRGNELKARDAAGSAASPR